MFTFKNNIWSYIWDFCEFYKISLPWGLAPWLFHKMLGSKPYKKVEEEHER